MASKRKSTTPCMVRATELIDQEDQDIDDMNNEPAPPTENKNDCPAEKEAEDVVEEKPPTETQSKKLQGGYECKYCPYVTQNLNEFTEHVDMQHPNVILNPLYVCAECNFNTKKYDSLSDHNSKHHPGESNFKLKLMKRNNQTILEQSIEGGADVSSTQENMETDDSLTGISISKMPISKLGKTRAEMKRLRKAEESLYDNQFGLSETNGISGDYLTHVMPSVQLPPNINLLPKVPVPLNGNKYNCALDTNATLIGSFNKFPYPTQAELSWLTAASKHPEEQIRIWFATQRLKHGISWSPEEVEEARKKMFNGTIQSVPQTFTVVPTPLTTTAKSAQPIIQTAVPCQFLGQTGLVFAQVANAPPMTVSSYSGNSSGTPRQKRSLQSPQVTREPKRPKIVKASSLSTPRLSKHERKKTREQIAILKASFVNGHFPNDVEVYRLIDITGLSRSAIKKWFSDYRYRSQRGICNITTESLLRDRMSSRTRRPYHYRDITPTKIAQMSDDHIQCLENSFQKNAFPTQIELDEIRSQTRLSRRQIHYWFSDRRKVRDSMEQAVLDSMGSDSNDGFVNGTATQSGNLSGSWAQSSPTYKSKQEQIHLLKSTFARTQWPTPPEYDQLANQTGLGRTEIVKWFKDNRCVLRNGSLRWMVQYRKMYELALEERKKFIKIVSATDTGKDILTKYFQEYGQLHEEDVDLLIMKAKLDVDELRATFTELQEQLGLDQLKNEQDYDDDDDDDDDDDYEDKLDLESETKSHGDEEEVISDGGDSLSQTGQDTQDDVGECGSTPKDDSCV